MLTVIALIILFRCPGCSEPSFAHMLFEKTELPLTIIKLVFFISIYCTTETMNIFMFQF